MSEPTGSAAEVAGSILVHNVLVFGRLLRSAGFPMSAGREMELLRARTARWEEDAGAQRAALERLLNELGPAGAPAAPRP